MEEEGKKMGFAVSWKRFIAMGIFLLIVWGSLLVFFYLKADEVTKDPCTICAERMGEKVFCTMGDTVQAHRTFYPNGSIVDTRNEPQLKEEYKDIPELNASLIIP